MQLTVIKCSECPSIGSSQLETAVEQQCSEVIVCNRSVCIPVISYVCSICRNNLVESFVNTSSVVCIYWKCFPIFYRNATSLFFENVQSFGNLLINSNTLVSLFYSGKQCLIVFSCRFSVEIVRCNGLSTFHIGVHWSCCEGEISCFCFYQFHVSPGDLLLFGVALTESKGIVAGICCFKYSLIFIPVLRIVVSIRGCRCERCRFYSDRSFAEFNHYIGCRLAVPSTILE